ncbi:G-I-Y Y-I-G endonuclease [Arthrobacter phage Sarge]|uniref:G-I-Y Y-I-G endonuclease n=1 Tax=Arthrobacter phage Sarge TaxID=2885974 RepID=A0AAE8Y5H3_9CAUD|nr:G-I-Y Y-I-G endonuclease [Arthrobacter phage Sarge]UDL14911.1 G-I-Y Y-I-G endonuclease [Arthrobacter phage Sarge]
MTIETAQPFDYKAPRLTANKRLHGDCAIDGCIFPHVHSLPLCEDHAYAAWAEVNGWRADKAASDKAEADRIAWRQQWVDNVHERTKVAEETRTAPGTIYYLQVENLIKIGFTRDLSVRLQAYPPMARLLATHPGTFQLEADLHKKFSAHLADRKEWFLPHGALQEHIERVRQDFKQDKRVTA